MREDTESVPLSLEPQLPAPAHSPSAVMLYALAASALGLNVGLAAQSASRTTATSMLYGEPRPVQIIPSVLPADWANST